MVKRHERVTVTLLLLIGMCSVTLDGQISSGERPSDNSDWWSSTRSPEGIQYREIADANLQIVGVNLRSDIFQTIYERLGHATVVQRGDSSTWREQVCYVDFSVPYSTYLIFEHGEVNSSFYLFSEAIPWNGRDLCARSKKPLGILETASGLHLGQTPKQVVGILGQPSERRENELRYFFEVKRKTPPDALARARVQHPELSEKQFHDDYDTYDLTVFIYAKFANSEMIYLGVSTAETS